MGADGQITLQKGRWDAAGTSFAADSSGAVNIAISAVFLLTINLLESRDKQKNRGGSRP